MDKEPPSEDSIKNRNMLQLSDRHKKLGHDIKGVLPTLIYIDADVDVSDKIVSTSVVFNKLWPNIKHKTLWITSFKEGFLALNILLKLLKLNFAVYHELNQYNLLDQDGIPKKFSSWGHEFKHMIVDNDGCRGLEAHTAIIFVEEESKISQQCMVENAGRSTSELIIINFHLR